MSKYSKYRKVHCCDSCAIRAGIVPKAPSDSGVESWYCHVCGHFGIGSMTVCKEGRWLSLIPIGQGQSIQVVGEHEPTEQAILP